MSKGLTKNFASFARPNGPDLLARTGKFHQWWRDRVDAGLWPYSRTVEGIAGPTTILHNVDGSTTRGLNFATQDYLSLAQHPTVCEAAIKALHDYGPHSAGSSVLTGNSLLSLKLEQALSELVQTRHIALFPTGWAACFSTVTALVRKNDHIVMDRLAHASLQAGAHAATPKIVLHDHLDVEAVRSHLGEIRKDDAKNGILVITEGLYSMDSDSPDLARIQEACHEFKATLLVDAAHDLGSLGPKGTGQIGLQGILGKVDLVVGAFSKVFATNGGFLATHSEAVKEYVRGYGGAHTFSSGLSPIQTAIALEAARIIPSAEGDTLRAELMHNVRALRQAFAENGVSCIGIPSPLVMVPAGSDSAARMAGPGIFNKGVFVNLVEFPAVPVGAARFRMQVMAKHTVEQSRIAARHVIEAIKEVQNGRMNTDH
jgi:glycine C-acetyltransferase